MTNLEKEILLLACHIAKIDVKPNELAKSCLTLDSEIRGAKAKGGMGLDSLDAVEFLMAVEDEFGVDVPDVEAEKMDTLRAVYDYILADNKSEVQRATDLLEVTA